MQNQPQDFLETSQLLIEKQAFTEALELARSQPESRDSCYIEGVCLRYLHRYEEALVCNHQLRTIAPQFARGWQEYGHLLRQKGDLQGAIAAYREALQYNPALISAWQNLALIHKQSNQLELAHKALLEFKQLHAKPPALLAVESMIYEEKLYQAEQLCRQYLLKNRSDVEGMRLLARIGEKLDILSDAEVLLANAIERQPENQTLRYEYAQVLLKLHRPADALQQMQTLTTTYSDNPAHRLLCANARAELGETYSAIEAYQSLIREFPDVVNHYLLLGNTHKTAGNPQAAIAAYQQAIAKQASHGDAWWSLANLKTYRFSDSEIERMESLLNELPELSADREQIAFALGKAQEDHQQFAAAFAQFSEGNRIHKTRHPYDANKVEREIDRQIAVFDHAFFEQQQTSQIESAEPIFILGLPRSGSTLIEQILASHSMVDGTIELPNILAYAQRLDGRHQRDEEGRYPEIMRDLNPENLLELAQNYLRDTAIYRSGAAYFTDKMPNNFRHIGLIHCLFPKARIIDARRHPMACCFSNFKQWFGSGQNFSYDLEDMARYYRDYLKLMSHWQGLLPGKILRVQHEALVADPEMQIRRMLDFLELPFENACLQFHQTKRAVHTPSAEQVRQPIYRDSIELWAHYADQLQPLQRALGTAITDYDRDLL